MPAIRRSCYIRRQPLKIQDDRVGFFKPFSQNWFTLSILLFNSWRELDFLFSFVESIKSKYKRSIASKVKEF